MGRTVDLDDLVGASEIAERLDASDHRVVHQWHQRYEDFPEPVLTLKRAMLWLWPEVEQWAATYGYPKSRRKRKRDT